MALQAWFPDETPMITPGQNVRLSLTVQNPSSYPETLTITPTGINVSWVTVAEPLIALDPAESAVVDVWVHPPKIATTSAGRNEVSVRIVAESDPSSAVTVDAVVGVDAFDDRSLAVLQPVVRGRRRATFELLVHNDGNAMANCRMHLIDPTERVDGQFDPSTVGVPPGDAALVRFNARVRGAWFRRADRLLPFQVDATETDRQVITASGSVLQPRTFDGGWFGRVIGWVGVFAALVGGWVFVARPWMQREVQRSVNQRVAAVRTDDDGGVTAVVAATTVPQAAASASPDSVGTPTSVRLAPEAAPGGTAVDSRTVEPSTTWYITDIVVQNPRRDAARASLAIDGNVVYEWDLSLMAGPNEFQPRITPLVAGAGSEVSFSVACQTPGASDVSGCTASVLLTARARVGEDS